MSVFAPGFLFDERVVKALSNAALTLRHMDPRSTVSEGVGYCLQHANRRPAWILAATKCPRALNF